MEDMIAVDDFLRIDIRAGTVRRAAAFPEARKPAIKLWIDFGPELGEKTSSAQITEYYEPQSMVGKQVMAIVNLPPRQIGKFMSEVLTLGVLDQTHGVVLLSPDRRVPDGARLC